MSSGSYLLISSFEQDVTWKLDIAVLSLSFVASLSVVICWWRIAKLRTFKNRLIVLLCSSDCLNAAFSLINIVYSDQVTFPACNTWGTRIIIFLMYLTLFSSLFWVAFIAFFMWARICHLRDLKQHFKKFFSGICLLSFCLSMPLLTYNSTIAG